MAANSNSPVHGELLVPERSFGVFGSKNQSLWNQKSAKSAFLFAAMGRSYDSFTFVPLFTNARLAGRHPFR